MRVSIALVLTGVILLPALQSTALAQQLNFSSGIQHVRVDVLVGDKGRPVLGLKPDDFEVLDNGIAQHVEFASFDQIPLNVIADELENQRLMDLLVGNRAHKNITLLSPDGAAKKGPTSTFGATDT